MNPNVNLCRYVVKYIDDRSVQTDANTTSVILNELVPYSDYSISVISCTGKAIIYSLRLLNLVCIVSHCVESDFSCFMLFIHILFMLFY